MMVLRSLLFNVAFYVNLSLAVVFGLPTMLLGRRAVLGLARYWGRSSLWLANKICNIKIEVRGKDNIRPGALLVAAKHQSIWETFTLVIFFDDFSYILKRELTWIPFFGWYLIRSNQIAINRGRGSSALAQITDAARAIFAEGRQLFIFPEGTRRPVKAPPAYKYGAAQVYVDTGVACLPVALNAGLFWPRRSFLRRPGTIVISFLPVIEPGLEARQFLNRLSDAIETETDRLIDEAIRLDPSLLDVIRTGRPE